MPAATRKIILVTGASSGIGAEVAREAARLGHRLALTARRADRLEALADEVRRLGAEAVAIPADLGDSPVPERLIAETVGRLGGLDVLINNAGIGLSKPFSQADPGAIRRQLEVNLVAPILLTRHALPHLIAARGMVINVGSPIASLASPAIGVYGTTKAGLAYWNDALRRELRHRGVSVCLVEPGPVSTEFFEALALSPPDSLLRYNALFHPPPAFLSARADAVARRIVRLIARPRRRLSVPRRVVWPFRALGSLFRLSPWLGDAVLSAMLRHFETPEPGSMPDPSRRDAT